MELVTQKEERVMLFVLVISKCLTTVFHCFSKEAQQ